MFRASSERKGRRNKAAKLAASSPMEPLDVVSLGPGV